MDKILLNYSGISDPMILTGGGYYAGFGSAMMTPSSGPGETVEQVIDVEFSGTQLQIEGAQVLVLQLLQTAAEQAAKPAGDLVYLECQLTSTDAVWRSPVYSGWFEPSKGGVDRRPAGVYGGKLHLVRANWWEKATETTVKNAQTVTNHRDSGHSNHQYDYVNSQSDDLPGQVRITAKLDTAVTAPASLFIGMRDGSAGVVDLFYEGQDGAAGAGVTAGAVADANSSDGTYYNLAWNGASETALWCCDIAANTITLARGKPFRAILRLADGNPTTATEKLWVRWRLVYVDAGGTERTLYTSPGAYLPNLQELVLGPILYLPPWYLPGVGVQLRVKLLATAAGSGAHALKLDWVDFAPLDGWRYFSPMLQSYGIEVNDYGQSGVAGPAGGVMTHAIEGPGFTVTGGNGHQWVFYWLVHETSEISASANLAGTVSIFFRPRRRNL